MSRMVAPVDLQWGFSIRLDNDEETLFSPANTDTINGYAFLEPNRIAAYINRIEAFNYEVFGSVYYVSVTPKCPTILDLPDFQGWQEVDSLDGHLRVFQPAEVFIRPGIRSLPSPISTFIRRIENAANL